MLEEIKLLRVEKGMSAQKIGEELGVSQYMVLQALKEIGLDPSDRNPRKAALLPTVTKMNKDGMTLTEISAATGVPSSTISRWLEGSREEVRKKKSAWSKETALELGRQGWKQKDIADEVGVHVGTVSRWLSKAGISTAQNLVRTKGNHNKKDKHWDKVLELHNQGLSPYMISKQVDASWGTIKKWIVDEGYRPHAETVDLKKGRPAKETPSEEEVLQEFMKGTPASTVDRKLKLKPGTTRDLALARGVFYRGGRYAKDAEKRKKVIEAYKITGSIQYAAKNGGVNYYRAKEWIEEEL